MLRLHRSNCIAICISLVLVALLSAACSAPTPAETPTTPPVTETPGIPEEPLVLYTAIPASRDEIPRITPEELKAMIDGGEPVVIVDCNPASLYRKEHIPGAISLPWDFRGLKEAPGLSKSTLIVAYCACEHEEDSGDVALQMITDFGYRNIKLLLGGNPKWRDLGYPMEKVE